MSLIKLELDNKKQETQYINMMINEVYEALVHELKDKDKISRDVLFCTPEEAEAVVLQNTSFEKVKCRIDDHGIAYFEVNADVHNPRGQKQMSIYHNTTSSTNTTSLTDNIITSDSSSVMYDSISRNDVPVRFTSRISIDSTHLVAALSNLKIENGNEVTIELPDGATLEVKANGSYEVKDDNAKTIYKANRMREFNRFINASDLLQEFISFLGTLGVKQGQVFDIPIELFINWLVFKAAVQDEEIPPKDLTPPEIHPKLLQAKEKTASPKCLCCGKFIRKDLAIKGFNFCNGVHASRFADRLSLAS